MTQGHIIFKKSLRTGACRGWTGFIWMMKILIPVSFCTALLTWTGWIEKGQFLIQPVMKWLSLPVSAALPLLMGIVTGIYGAIGAMSVLSLSREHMTLIAVFLLIAHSLIQEGAIQAKSGLNPMTAVLYRLAAATAAVILVAPFLNIAAPGSPGGESFSHAFQTLDQMLLHWLMLTLVLAVKLLAIITGVLMLLEVSKAFGWIDRVVVWFRPVFRVLGLSEEAGIIWMTAALFGLIYGAAVIVEEAGSGRLDKQELRGLQLSIGINHAVFEDPMLFMSFGLSPFWLWIPRLVMAIVAVRVYMMWHKIRARRPARR